MEEQELDALYINAGPNMRYFAGWSALSGGWPVWLSALIAPVQGQPAFVISKMHHDILKYSDSWLKEGDVWTYMDGQDPRDVLKTALKKKGLIGGRLGVEDTMWYADYDLLMQVDPTLQVQRAGALLDSLRQVKDEAEIEALRKANEITVLGYQRAAEVIHEGLPEFEAGMEVTKAMLQAGAQAVEMHGHLQHHLTRRFRKGDVIDVDMGARWGGYVTDTARNIFVGQPSQEVERAYQVTLEAFRRTVEMVKPGIEAQEVHRFAADHMQKHGYDQVWKIGHGVGLNRGHEAPLVQEGETLILEPGMVFVIDPGCFISGQFRDTPIHIEDCVVVTASGCENLTDFTREMIVV
jgi:Xaa-Pro aminopeptidase